MPSGKPHPLAARLDAIRLANDWTWEELAAATARADAPVTARTLYHFVKTMPATQPLDRTLFKVKKFLSYIAAHGTEPRRAPRRRKRATAATA